MYGCIKVCRKITRSSLVKPLENYKLLFTFNNGERKIYDVLPLLNYPAFKPLQDVQIFNDIKLDRLGAPTWLNATIDIAPETVYIDSVLIN